MVAGVHWDYDCYGGLLKKKLGLPTMMPSWDKDYNAGRALLEMNGLEVFEAPIHLEGGSIHSDGQGYVCSIDRWTHACGFVVMIA